jgi:hypothetical protein
MYSDDVHLLFGTTQLELGYRFEAAAARLGR